MPIGGRGRGVRLARVKTVGAVGAGVGYLAFETEVGVNATPVMVGVTFTSFVVSAVAEVVYLIPEILTVAVDGADFDVSVIVRALVPVGVAASAAWMLVPDTVGADVNVTALCVAAVALSTFVTARWSVLSPASVPAGKVIVTVPAAWLVPT